MNIKSGKLEGFDVDMAKEVTKRINPDAKVRYADYFWYACTYAAKR